MREPIAELAQALVPACWTPPPRIYHELHQRLAQRASLLEWRTQINNQLHALSVASEGVPTVRDRLVQLISQLDQHVAQLDKELLELVKIEQEQQPEEVLQGESSEARVIEKQWKAAMALLLTIPGVGLLTACWLVVATLNFPLCETAEAATYYVGLAPIMREPRNQRAQSREDLAMVGMLAPEPSCISLPWLRRDAHPVIKAFYEHLREAGKPMKVGSTACARKLLHIAFAVVKSERAFNPSHQLSASGDGVSV